MVVAGICKNGIFHSLSLRTCVVHTSVYDWMKKTTLLNNQHIQNTFETHNQFTICTQGLNFSLKQFFLHIFLLFFLSNFWSRFTNANITSCLYPEMIFRSSQKPLPFETSTMIAWSTYNGWTMVDHGKLSNNHALTMVNIRFVKRYLSSNMVINGYWPWLSMVINHGYLPWSTIGLWNSTTVQPWLNNAFFSSRLLWVTVSHRIKLQSYLTQQNIAFAAGKTASIWVISELTSCVNFSYVFSLKTHVALKINTQTNKAEEMYCGKTWKSSQVCISVRQIQFKVPKWTF